MTISLATVLNTHLPANNSSPLNNTSGTAKEGTTFSLHRSYSFVHTHLPDHLLGFLPHTPFKISHPIFNLQYAPIQNPLPKPSHTFTHAPTLFDQSPRPPRPRLNHGIRPPPPPLHLPRRLIHPQRQFQRSAPICPIGRSVCRLLGSRPLGNPSDAGMGRPASGKSCPGGKRDRGIWGDVGRWRARKNVPVWMA